MRYSKSRNQVKVVTVLLGLLVIMPLALAQPEDAKELPDADIGNAIHTQLLLDESVPSHRIEVTTRQGVVTLSGSVNNLLAKDRVVRQALTIKGVRSVVDELEIKPTWRADRHIRRDVIAALVNDPAADAYEIDVAAKDGVVTLTGTVQSWAERELSQDVAKGVRGVREVKSNIAISYSESRTDYEIEQDIVRRLAIDVLVDDGLLDVSVKDGRVTLTGAVGSAAERARAQTDAWVNGVHAVDVSNVDVKWWLRDEMRKINRVVNQSDEQLEQAVKDSLLYDPRVNSFAVDVAADNGVVTLTGAVDNLSAKRSAALDAENTAGVWRVKNLIAVRTTAVFSDSEVASDVRDALLRNPYVTASDVTARVVNGRAYLNGTVDSPFEKQEAEEAAASVLGVIEVDNNLYISSFDPIRSDWEIRQDIEDELFWSPFVDSDEVTVTVDNGVATLTGEVDTWSEFIAAGENAREGGALRVNNDLDLKYGPSLFGES